ncbi:MAG: hypothetical protein HZA81_04135 [Candidatus Taylorbacteria bacterium]|nr:hypothetical protein [Candidatus Taylorbacteria bacterium]
MEQFLATYGREVIILLMLWTLPWKGVSLWKAAHNGHKKWFIALLLINSLAVLDIIYIVFFSKKKPAAV